MSNEHWDQEISDALRAMTPLQPPTDLRARVLQKIGGEQKTMPLPVRPLLPARVRKAILLALPLLTGAAYICSLAFPSLSGPVFGDLSIALPDIRIPSFTANMSQTLQYAILAALAFSFMQVIMISRLWRRNEDSSR
jgi:MFS superfamily sulfate permease-like transporter